MLDFEGFEEELQKQKTRSRAASEQDVDDWIVLQDGKSVFVGYDSLEEKAKLPMYGTIGSLNVSVACGAFLYEAVRQRQ